MYSLHLTHPKWTHTRAVGSHVTAPGEQLGVGALLKDTSVVGNNPCDLRFEPTTFRLQVRLAIH